MACPIEYGTGRSDVGNHHIAGLDMFRHVYLVKIDGVGYQIALVVFILHCGFQIESDTYGLVVVSRQVEGYF